MNQSNTSNTLSESSTSKKQVKLDKMKAVINDENSKPEPSTQPKKNTLQR